jgi:hypothetical protein
MEIWRFGPRGALLLAGAVSSSSARSAETCSLRCAAPHHGRGPGQAGPFLVAIGLFAGLSAGFVLVCALGLPPAAARDPLAPRRDHYVDHWMNEHAYCQAQLHGDEVDNPDQRIAEDVHDFAGERAQFSRRPP